MTGQCGETTVHPAHDDCAGLDGTEHTRLLSTSDHTQTAEERAQQLVTDLVDSGAYRTPADAVRALQAALNTPLRPVGSLTPTGPGVAPIDVACIDCTAPPGTPCYTSGHIGGQVTHAARKDAARLRSVEHGTCGLCGAWMVRGHQDTGGPLDAWHPRPEDAARCPQLPDPARDWNAYAAVIQTGVSPGHPGLEHFRVPCTHPRVPDPATWGADCGAYFCEDCHTAVGRPLCPECVSGKHPNCVGQALDDHDVLVPCACPDATHQAPPRHPTADPFQGPR